MESNMNEKILGQNQAGWKISQSIALELDAALAIGNGHLVAARMSPEFEELIHVVPTDWKSEWNELQGSLNWFHAVMEYAAVLSGVLDEGDYTRATMVMRQTTPESALNRLIQLTSELNLNVESGLSPEETLIQLFIRYRNYSFESIGFPNPSESGYESRIRIELKFCLSIFQGGAIHDKFWHLLDRFYFGMYQPWRKERQSYLDEMERNLTSMVGAAQKSGSIPQLKWLPDLNPALRYPEINSAIQSGELFIYFWLEPFGFADYWVLFPGAIFLSFAKPGKMYENFHAMTETLSDQVKALADPTRLIILRLIREFSMTNTDMAVFLHISRPTVSIHAKVLREAGLIRSWEDGRITRHAIIPEAVQTLFQDLKEFLDLPFDQKNNK
jgi:DNA-binding transcriptional ArsR family regulator